MLPWLARPLVSALRADFKLSIGAVRANHHTSRPNAHQSDPNSGHLGGFLTHFSEESARTAKGANASDPETVWRDRELRVVKQLPRPRNTYSGRSFLVNQDFHGTYSSLQRTLSQNNLVYELRLAERHEKKGAKRRRLVSEQWRRRFAHEVRKKVQLVNEIRARGA